MPKYKLNLAKTEILSLKRFFTAAWLTLLVYTGVCALIGISTGGCGKGSPDLLYYITGGIGSGSVAAQLYFFMPALGEAGMITKVSLLVSIIIAVFELYDFFTDGQQISLAVLCDSSFHDKWVASFHQASTPSWVAYIIDTCHMSGLLVISLGFAVCSQAFTLWQVPDSNLSEKVALTASYVGCYIAPFLTDNPEEIKLFRAPTTGLLENLPNLYLQTSLFSLTFESTSDETKKKQLLSLTLSGASALKLALDVAILSARALKGGRMPNSMGEMFLFGVVCIYMLGSFALCILCAARVWFSYSCDSHLWNLTTGCVALD